MWRKHYHKITIKSLVTVIIERQCEQWQVIIRGWWPWLRAEGRRALPACVTRMRTAASQHKPHINMPLLIICTTTNRKNYFFRLRHVSLKSESSLTMTGTKILLENVYTSVTSRWPGCFLYAVKSYCLSIWITASLYWERLIFSFRHYKLWKRPALLCL